jgi:hypothetical protein
MMFQLNSRPIWNAFPKGYSLKGGIFLDFSRTVSQGKNTGLAWMSELNTWG